MNKQLKFLLVFCFLLQAKLFAQQQDITGMWNGELLFTDTAGELIHLPYEIAVSEDKGKLTGYSRIVFHANGKDEAGIRDINLKWKGKDIVIEDEEFLEHQFSIHTPRRVKKTMIMQLTVTDNELIMEGSWETNKVRGYTPAKGTSILKRKNDFKKSELYKRLDTLNIASKLSFKDRPSAGDGSATIAAAPAPEKKPELVTAPVIEPDAAPELIIPAIGKTTATLVTLNTKTRPASSRVMPLSKQKKTQMDLLAKSTLKPPAPKPTPAPVVTAAVAKPKPERKEPVRNEPEEKEPVTRPAAAPEKKPEPVAVKQVPPRTIAPQAYIAPSAAVGAAEIDKRITKADQSYYFESDSLVLTLYDNGDVDGDTVTVLMNGGIIFSKAGLTTKANTKTVYITPTMDSVSLVMYAESLGEIPPNTGLLIVNDGDKRYEIRFSADLKTNAAIVLRRKKNE
jgi:hypothetical protein